jgi:anti-anti-sigma factor
MSGSGDHDIPRVHTVVEPAADRCMVRVTGELDLLTGPVLLQTLDSLGSRPQHVSLDVAQLSFCDVAGLRAILTAQRVARDRGIRLTVCNTTSHFRWLLRVTGAADQLLDDGFTTAEPAGTAEPDSERDRRADDRELLDRERARLLDERAHQVSEHQRWEDIREDLANLRERDLEQRDDG